MTETTYSKAMPQKFDVADGGISFTLGRRAFSNKIYASHQINNKEKNLDYSQVANVKSSNVYGKPLENKSADLRIQRLRLNAIGSGSTRLNNQNEEISFKSHDVNLVNRALSRVRGAGSVAPKKGK